MRTTSAQRFCLFLVFICLINSGCALLGLENDPVPVEVADSLIKFSDQQTVLNTSNRQYKKMTRQKLEEESELHPQAGSMWVMEGQGAYLFAQNKTRKEGDLLNVKLDGSALKQVDTKVTVIRRITSLKTRRRKSRRQNRETEAACVEQGQPGHGGSRCRR